MSNDALIHEQGRELDVTDVSAEQNVGSVEFTTLSGGSGDHAPLSVISEQVAEVIVDAVANRREQAWVRASVRFVMSAPRHIPASSSAPD